MTKYRTSVEKMVGIEHRHIVSLLKIDEDQEFVFTVYGFIEGECLADRLHREGGMPEDLSVSFILKLARALSELWEEHDLIHGAIEPGRILLTGRNEPVLLGLGQSEALRAAGVASEETAGYMSPERSLGTSRLDLRVDIYSLGAVLYHLLTGRPPFQGRTPLEVLRNQATRALVNPRTLNPRISDRVALVIEQMMAKLRDQRYQQWSQVVAALEAVQAGEMPVEMESGPGRSLTVVAGGKTTSEIGKAADVGRAELPPSNSASSPVWRRIAALGAAALLLVLGAMNWPESEPDDLSLTASILETNAPARIEAISDHEPTVRAVMPSPSRHESEIPRARLMLQSSSALDFGVASSGSDSVRRQLLVRNAGEAEVRLKWEQVAVVGSFDFKVVRDPFPLSLPAGARTTIELEFRPFTLGRQRASVYLRADAADPQTSRLQVEAMVHPAAWPAASFANLSVKQNDVGNLTSSVTVELTGKTPDLRIAPGSNRGDYFFQQGSTPEDDIRTGVPIAVASQNGVDHQQGEGPQYAAVSIHAHSEAGSYQIASSQGGKAKEMNINCALAFFPFTNGWLCGHAEVAGNNGPLVSLNASSGLQLNPEPGQYGITDLSLGRFSLSLPGIDSQTDGVLLVCHGKDEGNVSLSKTEPDGSWTIINQDIQVFSTERDPVAFAFIPKDLPDVIIGRVTGYGKFLLASGEFKVKLIRGGEIQLTIAGHSPRTGVLIVSGEGGVNNNRDNVVSFEANGDSWLVQSRDTPGMKLQHCYQEPMFSFAFFPLNKRSGSAR